MAIPGLKPTFAVRSKVRVGEKRKTASGKEIPASTDYFIGEGIEGQPKELLIYFPFQQAEDNFSTGLEWWRGKQLTCYSKGEGDPPLAYRVKDMVGDAEVRGEPMGRDRVPVTCPVRDCEFLKDKSCKPMGRLQFWIDGLDRRAGVFQLDTKAWNSIENIEATLSQYPDLRGIPFKLSVSFTQRGTSRFPELYLEEHVEINNDADVAVADALVQLRKAVDEDTDGVARERLADLLDLTVAGWRERPEVIDRIKELGVMEASRKTLDRYGV